MDFKYKKIHIKLFLKKNRLFLKNNKDINFYNVFKNRLLLKNNKGKFLNTLCKNSTRMLNKFVLKNLVCSEKPVTVARIKTLLKSKRIIFRNNYRKRFKLSLVFIKY